MPITKDLLFQVCDSDLQILNINPNFPGSCNDKFVFKNSAVGKRKQEAYNQKPCWQMKHSSFVKCYVCAGKVKSQTLSTQVMVATHLSLGS